MKNLKLDKKLVSWFTLLVIIAIAAALRFYDLGGESYWYDEVIMVDAAQKDLGSIVLDSIVQGGRPPVYVSVAHFWIKFFGTREESTRSLSALAGIVAIPLIYLIGQLLFDRRVGLISAFLMAISQFQIYYSQDFRYYSLFVLMTLFSFFFYIQALKKGQLIYFVFYVLASILMFYTHKFGGFILAAQGLYFLFSWRNYRNLRLHWFLSQIFILLAILPSIINFFDRAKAGKPGPIWLPDPSFWTPLITLRNYVGAGLDYPTWLTLVIGFSFFLVGTLLFAMWRGKEQWLESTKSLHRIPSDLSIKQQQLLLIGLWLAVPILLPFIFSKILGPMYHHRYTICASPALYILLAIVITSFRKVVPEVISLGLIVLVIAPGLHEFYIRPVREQWRDAAVYVDEHDREGDVIVFADDAYEQIRKSFYWYYRGNLNGCSIRKKLNNEDSIATALKFCISSNERFWLVVREDIPNPIPDFMSFFSNNRNQKFRLVGKRKFTKLSVYLFKITNF